MTFPRPGGAWPPPRKTWPPILGWPGFQSQLGEGIRPKKSWPPQTKIEFERINGEIISASIDELPSVMSLKGNYPNPFNPVTTIQYEIASDAMVSLAIYDITGRLVESLINTNQFAGQYNVRWSAHNEPSGMYIMRLIVDGESFTQKMMLMK